MPEKLPNTALESPDYIKRWAKELQATIGKRDTATVLADYKRLAKDQRLTKHDRQVAAERARTLAKLM